MIVRNDDVRNDDVVWKKKLGEVPNKYYWLLAIENLAKEDQKLLF
jgi:hypothetical protein